ncbi:hypothetical protein BKA70DRAFT_1445502 [Coprinopsis sp. MPI-PUGE-AT-0042]|nr:hypothetical protein BKA70DRAFT_1445502 [Coprinopsis sp. MPI-PUGE-AT-0042]
MPSNPSAELVKFLKEAYAVFEAFPWSPEQEKAMKEQLVAALKQVITLSAKEGFGFEKELGHPFMLWFDHFKKNPKYLKKPQKITTEFFENPVFCPPYKSKVLKFKLEESSQEKPVPPVAPHHDPSPPSNPKGLASTSKKVAPPKLEPPNKAPKKDGAKDSALKGTNVERKGGNLKDDKDGGDKNVRDAEGKKGKKGKKGEKGEKKVDDNDTDNDDNDEDGQGGPATVTVAVKRSGKAGATSTSVTKPPAKQVKKPTANDTTRDDTGVEQSRGTKRPPSPPPPPSINTGAPAKKRQRKAPPPPVEVQGQAKPAGRARSIALLPFLKETPLHLLSCRMVPNPTAAFKTNPISPTSSSSDCLRIASGLPTDFTTGQPNFDIANLFSRVVEHQSIVSQLYAGLQVLTQEAQERSSLQASIEQLAARVVTLKQQNTLLNVTIQNLQGQLTEQRQVQDGVNNGVQYSFMTTNQQLDALRTNIGVVNTWISNSTTPQVGPTVNQNVSSSETQTISAVNSGNSSTSATSSRPATAGHVPAPSPPSVALNNSFSSSVTTANSNQARSPFDHLGAPYSGMEFRPTIPAVNGLPTLLEPAQGAGSSGAPQSVQSTPANPSISQTGDVERLDDANTSAAGTSVADKEPALQQPPSAS